MKFKVLINTVLSTIVLSISAPIFADCSVNINDLIIFNDGKVRVFYNHTLSSSDAYGTLCDLDEEFNNTSPSTCAVLTAQAQRARTNNSTLKIGFDSSASADCYNLQNYTPITYLRTAGSTNTGGTGNTGGTTTSTPTLTPSGVTTVTATLSSSSAKFSWPNNSSAPGPYWLEIYTSPNREDATKIWGPFLNNETETPSINDGTLVSGTTYYARLYLNAQTGYWGNNVEFNFNMP